MKKLITILIFSLCVFIGTMISCSGGGGSGSANANGLSAVWADINAIWDEINLLKAGEESVDMQDYATPIGMDKTFEQTGSPTTLTGVTYEEGVETWFFEDGSSVEHFTAPSAEGTMMTGRRQIRADETIEQDLTYYPAVLGVGAAGPLTVGTVWSAEYVAKKPDMSQYGTENFMYSVTAVEDVTVPAGTFEDCTKVFQTGTYNSTSWYAAGVGMVKRIGVQGLMELQSYTP